MTTHRNSIKSPFFSPTYLHRTVRSCNIHVRTMRQCAIRRAGETSPSMHRGRSEFAPPTTRACNLPGADAGAISVSSTHATILSSHHSYRHHRHHPRPPRAGSCEGSTLPCIPVGHGCHFRSVYAISRVGRLWQCRRRKTIDDASAIIIVDGPPAGRV